MDRTTATTGSSHGRYREDAPGRDDARADWHSLPAVIRRRGPVGMVVDVVRLFGRNDLLTYASAIGFQTLFAVITLTLTGLALLGFLQLQEVWRQDLAPQVAERTSDAAFTVIDDTVTRVLSRQRGFWLTLGAVLALWNVSSAIRAVMGALDDVYDVRERRSLWSRIAVSVALAIPVSLLFVGAVAAAQLGPRLVSDSALGGLAGPGGTVAGWGLAIVLLGVAVWLLVRFAPSARQPTSFTSVSSLIVVGFWLVASLGFGVYATTIASYGSAFGGLAFAFVALVYVGISAIAFLAGVQTDAYLRGIGSGAEHASPNRA